MDPARFLDPDAEPTAEELREVFLGVQRWMRSSGTLNLHRCLGLPTTTKAAQRMVRDKHLCRAAELLEGEVWRRADTLSAAVCEFLSRKWGRWRLEDGVPLGASPLDAHLWRAACATGGELPRSAPRLLQLLRRHFANSD